MPTKRTTSLPSSSSARSSPRRSGANGSIDRRPSRSAQIAVARPRTSANGRKMPLTVTSPAPGGRDPLAGAPAEQHGIELAEKLRRRQRRGGRAAGEVDEASGALDELVPDGPQPGADIAQRQARPPVQVTVAGRPMPGQIPAGQLCECAVAVHRGLLAEPLTNEHECVLAPDHRPADDHAAQGCMHQQVNERLPFGANAGSRDVLPQLLTCECALGRERTLQRGQPPLGVVRRHPLLAQPARVSLHGHRRGQRLQPRVVLAADEVQRAAVQPRHDQRPLLGQRTVDVRRRQPARARAHSQPEPARILRLHCEQALCHGDRTGCGRPGEQLRREALVDHAPGSSAYFSEPGCGGNEVSRVSPVKRQPRRS
jgi:hypothetical protein